jgi:LytTr DNA-binding domain
MDHLAFYKRNESLKETISQLRFTYSRPYTQYFIRDLDQMEHLLSEIDDTILLFYFTEKMTGTDQDAIQLLTATHKNIRIILLSESTFALKAWRLNIFHFDAYPVMSDMLTYDKWEKSIDNADEELILKTDEGIVKLKHRDILYLQAAGNYTMIHQSGDKCMVLTRQLGTFSGLNEQFQRFQRVHRSLILNFENVKACKNNMVYFHKSQKPLSISPLLESKIKKILMGHE